MDFSYFDILDYDTNLATVLITPTLQSLKGSIPSSLPKISLDYDYEDTGNSGKCPIKVHYDSGIPYNVKAKLIDRNGELLKDFGATIGSNGYDAVCSDLVDAKLTLWSLSSSWSKVSEEIASIDLNGVNGHNINIRVAFAPEQLIL
jgi:hypothetical protein